MRDSLTAGAGIVFLGMILLGTAIGADEGSSRSNGEVRLDSGITARFEYHHDRNALRDSRRAGEALIALTEAGNLLLFDVATLRLTRERFEPVAVACLGRGAAGAVLAGLEDGRICRVDPETLALDEIAWVPRPPRWVESTGGGGRAGPGLVAVVEDSKWVEKEGNRWERSFSVVHDLDRRKTYTLDRMATTFLLDRRHRLWLGGDMGEWGGWCTRLDLESGTLEPIAGLKDRQEEDEPGWDGVYGFVELQDGQVWAYGGTAHMGLDEAFIRRVDRSKPEPLYAADNTATFEAQMKGSPVPEATRPQMPITQIIEGRDGGLLIFSYSDIFRVDTALTDWKKSHELKIRYRWGRPDAMGAYPAVTAVHLLDDRAGSMVCATGLDGYIRIDGGKETHHGLPGQLGSGGFARVERSREGLIFLDGDDREPAWQLRDGSWHTVDFAPPFERLPDEPDLGDPRSWYSTNVLVGPSGEIITVSASPVGPGTRTTARWRDGKAEILGREISSFNTTSAFVTSDGKLWSAWHGEVERFEDGRWRVVAPLPEDLSFHRGLRPVTNDGPPWILLDLDDGGLVRMEYGPGGQAPQLRQIRVAEGDKVLAVSDALPWGGGTLLLATDRGLRLYDVASGKASPAPLPAPGRDVSSLCRDGLGRLWLAGAGLAMIDADGKALHTFDALPMMGRSAVAALAADAGHDDGVAVAMESRGVVLVRALKQ